MFVFCTNHSSGYASWLAPLGIKNTSDIGQADILLITGGVDVNPDLYNQNHGLYTNMPDVKRDEEEVGYFKQFVEQGKPILGVCRGSQLLCVVNGGELVQDSQHPYYHAVYTNEGRIAPVISTHHQQALLRRVEHCELIAWTKKLSPYHLGEDNKDYGFPDDYKEPEVVFYPQTRSLAIQSHPEMMPIGCEWVKFCQQLVTEKLIQRENIGPSLK